MLSGKRVSYKIDSYSEYYCVWACPVASVSSCTLHQCAHKHVDKEWIYDEQL